METMLRTTLLRSAATFCSLEGCGLSTLARRCRNDSSFFDRIAKPDKSFTVRTYDEVMAWFVANWPQGKEQPRELLLWAIEARAAA